MGGCVVPQAKAKKPYAIKQSKQIKPDNIKSPRNKENLLQKLAKINKNSKEFEVPAKNKINILTSRQLLAKYDIQNVLDNSTKMQGPKYISNCINGQGKVLRIYPTQEIDQERLKIYKQQIGFQVYEDEEANTIILDQYCCGNTIVDLMINQNTRKIEGFQQKVFKFICQVHKIISKFHEKGISLGTLQLQSFCTILPQNSDVRLVDFNFTGSNEKCIGFAHTQGQESDWQFFGYLLKYVTSKWSPVFISHKTQYSSNEDEVISKLLKGKPVDSSQLNIYTDRIGVAPNSIIYGYVFRKDLNKLLKIRKKRRPHSRFYYDLQTQEAFKIRPIQQALYRIDTQRIMTRIQGYIQNVTNDCQEPFMMYCTGSEKFKKIKEVFLIDDQQAKMDQLRQALSAIR